MEQKQLKLILVQILALIVLLLPLMFYGWCLSQRPPRDNIRRQLFSGISYQRTVFAKPRPYIVHLVEIDLTNPQVQPLVTPAVNQQYSASTTTDFVSKFGLQLAINGSFFYPFQEETPWGFYPRSGNKAIGLGESVAKGIRSGKSDVLWSVLCFSRGNRATITEKSCPDKTVWGISGKELLLKNGVVLVDDNPENYGRSAVGINSQQNKLWLVVVDGKQPFYSEGVTLKELANIFLSLGCDLAVNLDGGGSTTLVIQRDGKVVTLNAPIHTKIPMRERLVANHLGFYASSLGST